MFRLKDVLQSPAGDGDALSGSTSIEDDVREMGDEEEAPPTEAQEGGEEVTHEEADEADEEKESEEDKIEEVKEIPPHERPTITDLKTAFPDILKKFPTLRDILYREERYDREFGNIEDAVKAKEQAESFDAMHEDIFNGNGSRFLSAIKEEDPAVLTRFAVQFLPTLYKIDEQAHWAAANPMLEFCIRGFMEAGKDNEDVKKAADLFARYVFGQNAEKVLNGQMSFFPKLERKEENPEITQFRAERRNAFQSDVYSNSDSGLRAMIMEKNKDGILLLDPDEEFSPWLKSTLEDKILAEICNQVTADKRHMEYMNGLWKKAEKANFSNEWKSRLIDAFLARARPLVKPTRSRMVSEMRGTTPPNSERIRKVVKNNQSRVEAGGGGGHSKVKAFDGSRKVDYRKTSDEDILNDNIHYRS